MPQESMAGLNMYQFIMIANCLVLNFLPFCLFTIYKSPKTGAAFILILCYSGVLVERLLEGRAPSAKWQVAQLGWSKR